MSERDMRSKVTKALAPLGAIAVENPVHPGTPDVNFIEGWIELKWLRDWPKKPETLVRLDHPLMMQQRIWHIQRRMKGGQSWVLLQCKRQWFLFDGAIAAQQLGLCTQRELMVLAEHVMHNGLVAEELEECVSRKQSDFTWTAKDAATLRSRLQKAGMYRTIDT